MERRGPRLARWMGWSAALVMAGVAAAEGGGVANARGGAGHAPNRIFLNEDVFVPASQQVGDAVCVLCSVQVEGEVRGRVVVLFGSLSSTGRIDGNVTVVGGNAVFDGESRVGGNTLVVGGNAVYETEEVLAGDALVLGGHSSSYGTRTSVRRRLTLSPKLMTIVALLGCLLVGLAVVGGRRRREA